MLFRKNNVERWLVVGLGNPGDKFENTRHNLGFMAADRYAEKNSVRVTRARFNALVGEFEHNGKKIMIMKPTTYMNLSGNAVGAAASFYKIPAERIIVMCDDINLANGRVRIRAKGSAGGHNGLKSIAACISSEDYPRIRIGVGDRRSGELADWVLGALSKADREQLDSRFDDICSAIDLIIDGRLTDAQSRYNS